MYTTTDENGILNNYAPETKFYYAEYPSKELAKKEEGSSDQRLPTCHALAEPITCGSIIRLTHVETNKNLHSHGVQSPMSRQQEITAFGAGDGLGDRGDDWKVVCSTKYWVRTGGVQLQHVDTGKYLGTSSNLEFNAQTCGMNCPIMGHLEAFGHNSNGEPNQMTKFTVDQGIQIHV